MSRIGRSVLKTETLTIRPPKGFRVKGQVTSTGNRIFSVGTWKKKVFLWSPAEGGAMSFKAKPRDVGKVVRDFKALGWTKAYKKWEFSS